MGLNQLSKKTGLRALKALGNSVEEVTDKALEEVTNVMVADAVQDAPFRTGFLQSNIDNEKIETGHWQVKSEAPYSGYVEKGTTKMEARPYLAPAVLAHIDELNTLVTVKAEEKAKAS